MAEGGGLRELWQRGQRGWPAGRPIAQAPNPPLLVALAGLAVSRAASGAASSAGHAVFVAGLAYWGWLEVTDGASPFRRVLGVAGLGVALAQAAGALGD